jgi:predicted site-specific integrase-resolvase
MERLNTKQALAILGWTHRNTLYGYVKSGVIPCHRGNGRNYYLRHELEAFIKGEVPASIAEIYRRAQEAGEYAERGEQWPPSI